MTMVKRLKYLTLVLGSLCQTALFGASFHDFSCSYLLCLVDPVRHCNHLVGEEGLVALLFLICCLSTVCLGLFALSLAVFGSP